MRKRVVVTGLGIVSAIGNDVETAWQNAVAGNSGVTTIDSFATDNLKVGIAASVRNFQPEKYMSRLEIRRQDLFSQYSVYAAHEAFKDAGLTAETIDPKRMGCILGSGMGGMKTYSKTIEKAYDGGMQKIPPMFIPMIIPNMGAGNISIALNAQGYTSTVSTACASGAHALGDAFRMIQHGYADVMISGGTEASVDPYTIAGFAALTALSTDTDPTTASRPFDATRNGFVLGEGAGMLILESLEHAQKRGAKIYGEIIGFGATSDAYHITAPSGYGAQDAMQEALDDANIKADAVSYINAHGTSTPLNDAFETKAIKAVFGDAASKVSISSTKSVHGHALGATAGIEAVLCLKAIENDIVPPTMNLNHPDPECNLDYTPNKANHRTVDVVMSNSLGFGGHNAVLLFRKFG